VRQVYRSDSIRPVAVSLTFADAVLFFEVASHGKHRAPLVATVAVLVFATLFLIWIWAFLAQMGVITSTEGIVVRNYFRRFVVRWTDVEAFRFGEQVDGLSIREMFTSPYLQPYVILKNGKHHVMNGLQITRVHRSRNRKDVQTLLDYLEKERLLHV
jgi:hypothetical protein